ncbi:hypothetical protein Leryth_018020 [Lithospermum erythrorhizon]|uniref:Anther-specific protein BCP1 n=1 Tax=Lithospermum erythrorhizon TaxID=34254 RepID=A0AAV3NIU2_LITER|nr:hypothetical protein Leryth_018020 [Lithospermum erythrorhizon]
MARKYLVLAFALFAIVGMASAWSSSDDALPPVDDSEVEALSPSTANVIGPLDGGSVDAAPIGGPVSPNEFPDLSPAQAPTSAGATFGVSAVASVVATAVATSLFF